MWFILKGDFRRFMFGEEDDVEVKSVCGAVDGIGEEGEGEGDADGGDEWQHTDTEYESSEDEEEEGEGRKVPPYRTQGVEDEDLERPRTPPNQTEVESEKVDSVLKGKMPQGYGVATGRDEGASPKARSGYTRGS